MTESPAPTTAARTLVEMLELEQIDSNLFRSRANQFNNDRPLFGGQILGQGFKAAGLTVDSERHPHSLHGYFLLPGSNSLPVIYDVELTRDGGSFSTRRVVAHQRGKTIFHMEISFHRKEKQSYEHEVGLDIDVPDPEQLLSLSELAERYADVTPEAFKRKGGQSFIDMRPVSPEDFLLRKAATTRALYWMKSSTALPDDPLTHMAALAYLSDYCMMTTAILKHTESVMSAPVFMASLDHAMWFHQGCRADDWVLIDAMSPYVGDARGFSRGQMFDSKRRLVASVAQEGLVRLIQEKA